MCTTKSPFAIFLQWGDVRDSK